MSTIVQLPLKQAGKAEPQDEIDDTNWKTATVQGNDCFGKAQYSLARQHYRLAMLEALSLLANTRNGTYTDSPSPAPILVVSASNLANAWLSLNDPAQALVELQQAIVHLADVLQDDAAPSILRGACVQHLPRAIQERARIRQEHDLADQAADETLKNVQKLIFEYLQSRSLSN